MLTMLDSWFRPIKLIHPFSTVCQLSKIMYYLPGWINEWENKCTKNP